MAGTKVKVKVTQGKSTVSPPRDYFFAMLCIRATFCVLLDYVGMCSVFWLLSVFAK